jgi:L-lactate dehydrogenase complex protein LldE
MSTASTPSNARPTVALFVTCLTDQFYPQVAVAVTKILEHFGCAVEFPATQTCCGQPFFNNGYSPEAASLARRFVETFENYDYIVTPSGSCCAMIREFYPTLLENDGAYGDAMRKVVGATREFVEFLTDVLKVDLRELTLPSARKLTFHYTCHSRALGLTDQCVKLLKQIGNVDFVPLEKTDQCCGFGGTFAVKYPAISGAIVADKVANIRKSAADAVICNEAGCTMNIAGMCHREQVKTPVVHFAEVLADALGLDDSKF